MKDLRKIDDLGRLVLPTEMRNALGWSEQQTVSIELDQIQNILILKQENPCCFCCGATQQLKKLPNGKLICQACLLQAKPLA